MEFDESKIIEECDEEKALAWLLVEGYLFLSTRDDTTTIFVNANDVFMWACADAEKITNNDGEYPSEILELYKLCKQNKKWGAVKWLCLKRKLPSQQPIINDMIKDGYWDNSLETITI